MKNICCLGIDPGASGALAFLFTSAPDMVSAEHMPLVDGKVCAASLAAKIRVMNPDFAVVEFVSSMPKQGVVSTFNFGVSFGKTIGIIQALGIPLYLVKPQKWKKHFALSSDKEKSRELAKRMWPTRCELFERKKDEARAEAALIARYGLEVILQHQVSAA